MSEIHSYHTILTTSKGLYKEKGSKFLSFAHSVESLEQIKKILSQYQKEYYDARHICYAYMLGAERKIFRANDDGEPSGTAGRPILGQINAYHLTNILVVVIRYFGGVLLGTGGLVTAYKEATIDALNEAEIVEKKLEKSYSIDFDYSHMSEVMHIIKQMNAEVVEMKMEYNCQYKVRVIQEFSTAFFEKINSIYNVKIEPLEN